MKELNEKTHKPGLQKKIGNNYRSPNVFVVPDEFEPLRKRLGWYTEIKKIEHDLKALRERISQLSQSQAYHRKMILQTNEYCANLDLKRQIFSKHPLA